jgi:hypothetical protein
MKSVIFVYSILILLTTFHQLRVLQNVSHRPKKVDFHAIYVTIFSEQDEVGNIVN